MNNEANKSKERDVAEKAGSEKSNEFLAPTLASSAETSRLGESTISNISSANNSTDTDSRESSMSGARLRVSSDTCDENVSVSRVSEHSGSTIIIQEDLKKSQNITDSEDLVADKGSLNYSDVVLVEESDKSADCSKTQDKTNKTILEISGNSDVHIVETPDKDTTDTKSLNDSVQIISPTDADLLVLNDSDIARPLPSPFKKIESKDSGKFSHSVFSELKGSNFDSQPAYSTPNELKSNPEAVISESTESISLIPPIYKKIGFYVELTTAIHMNKESWTGEINNVGIEFVGTESVPARLSDSSGHVADVSKSGGSPSSSSSVVPFALKATRISMASMSSSSSGLSSASTLARKLHDNRLLSRNKKDEGKFIEADFSGIKLTDSQTSALYDKWSNSREMCGRIMSFIDKNILNAESINDDSVKFKVPAEEPIEKKELKTLGKIEEVTTPVSTTKARQTRGKRQAKVKYTSGASSESEVPKKRQRRLEPPEVKIPFRTKFSVGDNVFAKWGDRKFYAASLGQMTTEGRWQVNFFDGDKKSLLEEFLIKAEDYSTMVGSNVFASQGDDNFTPGIITDFEVRDGVLHYVVVRDTGDISVPCQYIYINESQARQIRAKSATTTTTTTMKSETIVSPPGGKRSTRSKCKKQVVDSPKPSVSGTRTEPSTVHLSDTDDDGHDDDLNLEDVAGVEPESQGVYENGIQLKGKALTGKNKSSGAKKIMDTDASVLGPVPDEGSKYFRNLHFLLTCTRPQNPKFQIHPDGDAGSSDNATSSENEHYSFSTIPFVKDRLKQQLQRGGGTVYNNFDEIDQKHWRHTYLISNRPNNSARYIQCLAAGIKIICHEWVIRCCTERKKLPLQELPLGWSLERERYYNCHDRKSSNPLKKLHLLIAETGDKSFVKFWTKICKLADIQVAKLTRDSNLEHITAVISESGYKDETLERAMSHTIPIVTTTWLIQSLLHGEPRPFSVHKSYQSEYIESD